MRRALLIGTALCICIATAAILARRMIPSRPEVAGDEVVIIGASNPSSLDPTKLLDVHTHLFVSAVHAPLALVGEDHQLVPVLAESLHMSDDGMTCTVKLREARFSDGSEVTAEDCVYSFRRLARSGHPQSYVLNHVRDDSQGLTAPDHKTLVVRFRKPDCDWPWLIANSFCSIVKAGSGELPGQPLDQQIIGAGPYKLVSAEPGARFGFVANTHFPHQTGFSKMAIQIVPSEQAQLASLADRTADMVQLRGPITADVVLAADSPAPQLRDRFSSHTLTARPANELVTLFINWKTPELASLSEAEQSAVYRAMREAVSREQLVRGFYMGRFAQGVGHVTPPVYGDASAAASESAPSTRTTLRLGPVGLLAANDADSRRLAEAVCAGAADVGITLHPTYVDLATLATRVLHGESGQMALIWFEMNVGSPDPLPWSFFFDGGSPFAALGQPIQGVGSDIDAARALLLAKERHAAYVSIFDRIDSQQRAWVPLISREAVWLHDKRVSAGFMDVNGQLQFALLQRSGG